MRARERLGGRDGSCREEIAHKTRIYSEKSGGERRGVEGREGGGGREREREGAVQRVLQDRERCSWS